MAGKNDLSPVRNQVLNGWDSSSNPSIISDVLVVIERDIQISSDKDFLALQIRGREVANALLGHGDNLNRLGRGLEGSGSGDDVIGEDGISDGCRKGKAS